MNHEDIERLLGGYAGNTLSEEERKALFAAAMDDQSLFDALQDEEPLRDLLSDQESRKQIEQALKKPAEEEYRLPWWRRPWILAFAGSMAAGCLLLAVLVRWKSPPEAAVRQELAIVQERVRQPLNQVQPARLEPERKEKSMLRKQVKAKEGPSKNGPVASPAITAAPAAPAAPPPPITAQKAQAEATEMFPKQNMQAPLQTQSLPSPVRVQAGSGGGSSALATGNMYAMRGRFGSVPAVSIVRGDQVLGPGDTMRMGDTVRVRVRPVADGNLQIFELDATGAKAALTPPQAVLSGQDVTLPTSPITIYRTETLLVVFTGADGNERTTHVILAPGKTAIVR